MLFCEADEVAKRWGVRLCNAELERLTAPMAAALQTAVVTRLKHLALVPLADRRGWVMAVQIDGVFVFFTHKTALS